MPVYKSIADSIHKYIEIPKKIYVDLIDTVPFQRLRRLGQVGGVHISYPSATHSRFIHSLGTFHIANRIVTNLKRKRPELVSKDTEERILISALIHDIGHGPFSHLFEDAIKMLCNKSELQSYEDKYSAFRKHENITKQFVIAEESEISRILDYGGYDKKRIADLIIGRSGDDKTFVNQIIASQLDADSLDYLMRDSVATGVSFGLYNLERLFAMMDISPEGRLIVKEKGLQSTEQVIIARYMQFTRVYFHKTVRCWDFMLKLYISQLLENIELGKDLTILPFIQDFVDEPNWKTLIPLTDDIFYTQLQLSADKETNGDHIKHLAKDFLRRSLFKSIPLTEKMASIIDNERAQVNAIITKYGYPENFWDIDRFVSRYYTPYDEANKDAITIKMKDGQLKQLSEVSDVVSSLSKPKYNNLLIFPAACRKDITTFIKKIEE